MLPTTKGNIKAKKEQISISATIEKVRVSVHSNNNICDRTMHYVGVLSFQFLRSTRNNEKKVPILKWFKSIYLYVIQICYSRVNNIMIISPHCADL